MIVSYGGLQNEILQTEFSLHTIKLEMAAKVFIVIKGCSLNDQ